MQAINKQILGIALPAVVANVTVPLLGLVDVGVAGHIGQAVSIGAISVATMMFNLIYWNFGFLRMGTSGLTAQALGKGDRRQQAMVLQQACAIACVIAALIMLLQAPLGWVALKVIGPSQEVGQLALTYYYITVWGALPTLVMMALKGWLLGMQNSKWAMAISISVTVLNIVLSLACVYGLDMGFAGIAAGTLAAEWAGLLLSLAMLRKGYGWLGTALAAWKQALRLGNAGKFFKVSGDIFVRSFMLMAINLFFLAAGARSGDMVLAANSLAMQLYIFFSYFTDGIAFAGEALVGKFYGSRNAAMLRLCVRRLLQWGVAIAVTFAVAYLCGMQGIMGLLTSSRDVIDAAMQLRWWCAALPLAGILAFVLDGVFIGLTRTRSMLLSVMLGAAFFFAFYFLLPAQLGNNRLWLAFALHLLARGTVLLIAWKKFSRKVLSL